MRNWTPQSLYDLKPWVFVVAGAFFGVGTMLRSLWAGLAVVIVADLP
ncbi:MAG TPA: hypothetical protein VNH39_05935 [Steroidobacteraceae bacterium]|nr:hypothetical protein [Steroidobacteraceae bacterium]